MDGTSIPTKAPKLTLKRMSKTKDEGNMVSLGVAPRSGNQTFMIDSSTLLGKTRLSGMGDTVGGENSPKVLFGD